MRLTCLVLLCVCLGVLTSGQTTRQERREKLQRLIAAARNGDENAKTTLANLRSRLRSRANNVQSQPKPEPVQNDPIPFETPVQQNEVSFGAPEPKQIRQPARRTQPLRTSNTFQSRQPRLRVISNNPEPNFLEPHRALNRGLEIDERSEANAIIRVTNETNTPPIQTIRRYSYFDEEGNYIFGYEAADGSFKEETRGRNCIVHGKYGYVDPDGVKREFNYISGNECNPDAPVEHDLQGNEINPLPKNEQFLIQTEEKQLDQATLNELQFNQIRRPVQQQQPRPRVQHQPRPQQQFRPQVQQQFRPQEQQPIRNRVSSRRRQQNRSKSGRRGNAIVVQEEQFLNRIPQEPEFQPKPIQTTQSPIRISTFRPPQPVHFQQPSLPVFRPTPRPISSVQNTFDFDKEFNRIFNNFGGNRPRPVPRPAPRPQTFAPHFTTTRRPTTPRHTQPPQTKRPTTQRPTFSPTTERVHKQLVFDAVSGGFKSVPLKSNSISSPFTNTQPQTPTSHTSFSNPSFSKPSFNQPFQHSFSQPKPQTGRPLPLPGFNPLPPVPLGSLSIQGNTRTADFDRFFSHFNVQ